MHTSRATHNDAPVVLLDAVKTRTRHNNASLAATLKIHKSALSHVMTGRRSAQLLLIDDALRCVNSSLRLIITRSGRQRVIG